MNTLTLVLAGVAIVMLLVSNVEGKFFVIIYFIRFNITYDSKSVHYFALLIYF